MKYKILMCNAIFVNLGRLINGIYATDVPHLWPDNTTIESIKTGYAMLFTEAQNMAISENLQRCKLVDVELLIPEK